MLEPAGEACAGRLGSWPRGPRSDAIPPVRPLKRPRLTKNKASLAREWKTLARGLLTEASALQSAERLARTKVVYEGLHPETRHGAAPKGGHKDPGAGSFAFVDKAASATGWGVSPPPQHRGVGASTAALELCERVVMLHEALRSAGERSADLRERSGGLRASNVRVVTRRAKVSVSCQERRAPGSSFRANARTRFRGDSSSGSAREARGGAVAANPRKNHTTLSSSVTSSTTTLVRPAARGGEWPRTCTAM
jgi:hypothetical protein